jgi:hypothetical protein
MTEFHPVLDRKPNEVMEHILKQPEEERRKLIALWVCRIGFEEIKPVPLPTIPPRVYAYLTMDSKLKAKYNENPEKFSDFWMMDEVRDYFSQVLVIKTRNRENLRWLRENVVWLDGDNRKKVEERIEEFRRTA